MHTVFRFPIYNTGPAKKFFETKSQKNTDKSPIIGKVDSTYDLTLTLTLTTNLTRCIIKYLLTYVRTVNAWDLMAVGVVMVSVSV